MDFSHVLGPETTLKSAKKVQIIRENIFHKKKKISILMQLDETFQIFNTFFLFLAQCVSPLLSQST